MPASQSSADDSELLKLEELIFRGSTRRATAYDDEIERLAAILAGRKQPALSGGARRGGAEWSLPKPLRSGGKLVTETPECIEHNRLWRTSGYPLCQDGKTCEGNVGDRQHTLPRDAAPRVSSGLSGSLPDEWREIDARLRDSPGPDSSLIEFVRRRARCPSCASSSRREMPASVHRM